MAFKLRCPDDAVIDFSALEKSGLRVDDQYSKKTNVGKIMKKFGEEHESAKILTIDDKILLSILFI